MSGLEAARKKHGVKACAGTLGLAFLLAASFVGAEPKVPGATKATVVKTATPEVAPPAKAMAPTSNISSTLGGHVGVAVPLVTVQGYTSGTFPAAPLDRTRTVSDQFTLAIPIGVTIRTSRRWAVDLEFTVATSVHPTGETNLTIDPGVIYDWGPVATGLRLAVPIGAEPMAIGLIPLINRQITQIGGATWFVEAAFPTLYHGSGAPVAANTAGTNSRVEFNAVLHTGFGF